MNEIFVMAGANIEKIAIGALLFFATYLANVGLGAWRNVTIGGANFDWKLILQSGVKFVVLGLSIAMLTFALSMIPAYATYIGIEIDVETLKTIDSLIITSAFFAATIRYALDAVTKLKEILK